MPVIAIAREIGAGGPQVAEIVAGRLGADVVDRRIIDEIARRLEMGRAEAEELDESPGGLLERLMPAAGAAYWAGPVGLGAVIPPLWDPPFADDPTLDIRRATVKVTEEAIRSAAQTGNAVILGRGAAYVLGADAHVLRVALKADRHTRVQDVMQRQGLDEVAARKRVEETDANRQAYVKHFYKVEWGDLANYDLVLDTGRLGIGGSAELILSAVATVNRARGDKRE